MEPLSPDHGGLKVFAVTLGCPKNRVDTETGLASLASAIPIQVVEGPEEADLLLVNTCGFLEAAVSESIETILSLAGEMGPRQRLLVAGCMVNRYGAQLEPELPEVDRFLRTHELVRLGEILAGTAAKGPRPRRIPSTPPWWAYLKVAEGCSNRCTYCLIPRIRGPQRDRPATELVEEARELEERGVKELILVAQELTAYGGRRGQGLVGLLEALLQATSIPWIRLLYLHPKEITPQLLYLMAREERICNYLDIPIQHACNAVLRRMGRGYTAEEIEALLGEIRERLPHAAVRTTVMVGFPGEGPGEVDELLRALERWRFDHLGCFVYSDEEEAPSSRLPGKVAREEGERRRRLVMELQAEISRERNRRWVGRRLEVLVEGVSPETDFLLVGRTRFQAPEIDGITYINRGRFTPGEIAELVVEEAHTYDLVAGSPGGEQG